MKFRTYTACLYEALKAGKISEEAYNAAVENAFAFCDEDEDDECDHYPVSITGNV